MITLIIVVVLCLLTIDFIGEFSWTCRRCGARFEHGSLLDLLNPWCPSCKKDKESQ